MESPAYKAVELVRLLIKAGHSVRVVQTPASLHFVGRATFEGITGAPLLVDEFEARSGTRRLSRRPAAGACADLAPRAGAAGGRLRVAPATANTIAKLAGGLADNLLTSAALACTAPLLVAPAMNDRMYEHAATARQPRHPEARGVQIVPPGTGPLASKGNTASGAWLSRRRSLAADRGCARHGYAPRSLDGLRVLVTAGGTREPIDAVRYVGNRSSGRMGLALAEEAARRGAEVTLVAANVALPRAAGVAWSTWRRPPSSSTPRARRSGPRTWC